jgi:hypothetical protein
MAGIANLGGTETDRKGPPNEVSPSSPYFQGDPPPDPRFSLRSARCHRYSSITVLTEHTGETDLPVRNLVKTKVYQGICPRKGDAKIYPYEGPSEASHGGSGGPATQEEGISSGSSEASQGAWSNEGLSGHLPQERRLKTKEPQLDRGVLPSFELPFPEGNLPDRPKSPNSLCLNLPRLLCMSLVRRYAVKLSQANCRQKKP